MQLTQQTVNRTLECVWKPSGEKLSCVWVQRERQSATPASPLDHERDRDGSREIGSDPRRRVA